jgi:hypothetical protein
MGETTTAREALDVVEDTSEYDVMLLQCECY